MLLKDMIEIANALDQAKMKNEADFLDRLILKKASDKVITKEDILDKLKSTIFSSPYSVKSAEDYEPYILTLEETEKILEKYDHCIALAGRIEGKYSRLYEEIVAFAQDEERLAGYDVKTLIYFPELYQKEHRVSHISKSFMWPLVNGGVYGFIKELNGNYNRIYLKKKDYFTSIEKVEEALLSTIEAIPEDLEDLIIKLGLTSKDEFSEALFYLFQGLTPYKIKAEYQKVDLEHPLKKTISNANLRFILNAGRRFKKVIFKQYERNGTSYDYNKKLEEKTEVQFWPTESDEEEFEKEELGTIKDKRQYILDFAEKTINLAFDNIYEKSGKVIIEAVSDAFNEKINEFVEHKFSFYNKIFKAYGVADAEIEAYKINFKKSFETNLKKYSPTHKIISDFYRFLDQKDPLALQILFTGGKLLSSSDRLSDIKKFFIDKIIPYLSEIDISSKEEATIDLVQIVAKIDQAIGQDIKNSGLKKYFSDTSIFNKLYDINDDDLPSMIQEMPEEINESFKNGDIEATKRLILYHRFNKDKTTGFKNFNKLVKKKAYTTPFLGSFIYILHAKYLHLIQTAQGPEEKQKSQDELEAALLEANEFSTEDSQIKYRVFKDIFPKVISKIYQEEEMFMLGKRDKPLDVSNEIAKSLGIKDLTNFLHERGTSISLPGIILDIVSQTSDFVKLYFAFSNVNEYNSIERMNVFLIKLLKTYYKYRDDSRTYSLKLIDDFNSIKNKITGTREEKIEKILAIANLIDNNKLIKEEIQQSKYIDKVNLDIFQKIIKIFSGIKSLSQDEPEHDEWGDLIESSNEDFISKILKIKDIIIDRFGMEKSEQIFSSKLIDILSNVKELDSLDQFIEYFKINFSNLSGDEFVQIKEDIALILYGLQIANQIEALIEHYNDASPKDKNLFKLNLNTPTFRFRVLNDLDPYHFQVGIDTDCCQTIGGVGEEAAIDSFINPLAGVVLLEVLIEDQWTLAAQSYFHYVPEGPMVILDNIEKSPNKLLSNSNIKNITGYTFPEMYYVLAKHLQDQGIKKVLVGEGYTTVLSTDSFGEERLKYDPREFKVSEPYTDFDYRKSYDLLAPKFELKNMPEIKDKQIIASGLNLLIKFAALSILNTNKDAKLIKLNQYLIKNNFIKEAAQLDYLIFSRN